ncbi:MAG: ArsR family transcriptional regulator, partial [Candidatus Thermoplasmatota archaeon]
MKQKNINILDEKDYKAVGLFTNLGMPKNLAKTLLYIYQVDECRSADIEHAADLRQPEVSIAMQELRRRGWIKKRDL